MSRSDVFVTPRGGLALCEAVVCDGFLADVPIRVQTHIHGDHMVEFETSKGFQRIIMSEPTRELLICELDADIPFRNNIVAVDTGQPFRFGNTMIELESSGHMLGAVQVSIESAHGAKAAYSGDFSWPLARVLQTDVLVVDSTYGSPDTVRNYSPSVAEARLVELTIEHLQQGPVHIKAHRGCLERALEAVNNEITVPIVASTKVCELAQVYRRFGYHIGDLIDVTTQEAAYAEEQGQYVRFYGKGDGDLFGITKGATIQVSAYMSDSDDPVIEWSPTAFRVAMSAHADFKGTMEYVAASGASEVIVDNSRGGHPEELASAIRSQLGVHAAVSERRTSRYWGR